MLTSTRERHRHFAAAALLLGAAISLTACGEQRGTDPAAGAPAPPPPPSSSPAFSGASPYVEPGAGDGAPHYNENNAGRRPREMSVDSAEDARKEADRILPVLRQLWKDRKWDVKSVRAAMLKLGYEEERTGAGGKRLGGSLTVKGMEPRFETDHYVTPEGARVGLRVHDDACVKAFVQKTNYEVRTNGPYLETGCFEPPFAH
ncbi:hypothetical protein [Streptomyces sp. ME19-01-6]|uniref:hypothetical protein n=1 Tax=Streptomyces sp. ME19-01-6 TaxID=3028686 RepID=UPI0029A38C24|nr:hypothetical protein [Streptomyces sp. ME19-01-6]MDX3229561.1 hypothetical protein [Streptomyces sp. ME19-01-6]